MSARLCQICCLLFCVLVAALALAQEGHPAKGTWTGYWGPTATENRVVIVMDYDGKNISGTVNPGANAVPIKLARLDITPGTPPSKPGEIPGEPTFKLHIEADTKDAKGNSVSIVADGTLRDVGLPGRAMVGAWTQTSGGKTVKGDFRISRQ